MMKVLVRTQIPYKKSTSLVLLLDSKNLGRVEMMGLYLHETSQNCKATDVYVQALPL